jgi:hypothetical protein
MQHAVDIDLERTLLAAFGDGRDAGSQVVKERVKERISRYGHSQQCEMSISIACPLGWGDQHLLA